MQFVYISIVFIRGFFLYLGSILYQRGIYSADSFKREQFYDMTLFKCDNEELQKYLSQVLQQVKGWCCLTTPSPPPKGVLAVYMMEI